MSKPASPQCQSYTPQTDPAIRDRMKRDTRRAIVKGILTRSTDAPLETPGERISRTVRSLFPARFGRKA